MLRALEERFEDERLFPDERFFSEEPGLVRFFFVVSSSDKDPPLKAKQAPVALESLHPTKAFYEVHDLGQRG